MTTLTPVSYIPRECYLRVQISKAAEQTSGGIWLPEECQVSCNEAEVLSVGPGIPAADGFPCVMWAEPGDHVLFQQHSFQKTDERGVEGIVREDDLLAIIPQGEETIQPHNDWVKVSIEAPERESQGGILLADRARKKPQSGKIMAHGPGKFRRTGPYFGTRKSIPAIMGLNEDSCLVGRKVWWGREADVLEAGAGHDWFLLIRASDLLLIEGECDEG
jgi:co-chaperonin GroES (HSP10)